MYLKQRNTHHPNILLLRRPLEIMDAVLFLVLVIELLQIISFGPRLSTLPNRVILDALALNIVQVTDMDDGGYWRLATTVIVLTWIVLCAGLVQLQVDWDALGSLVAVCLSLAFVPVVATLAETFVCDEGSSLEFAHLAVDCYTGCAGETYTVFVTIAAITIL
jgi:hypothetical protein